MNSSRCSMSCVFTATKGLLDFEVSYHFLCSLGLEALTGPETWINQLFSIRF